MKMKNFELFVQLLLIFFISQVNCKKQYNTDINLKFEFNYIIDKINETIFFENVKYLKNDDDILIFRNFPRRRKEDINNYTFTKYDEKNKTFSAWPDDQNDYNGNKADCSRFVSIIDFEFDEEKNIYLLDDGNLTCPITLYIFNLKGVLQDKYTIFENNTSFLLLSNFVIDKINNYSYIPFYLSYDNKDNLSSAGFFIINIKNKNTTKVYLNNSKFLYDEKYNFNFKNDLFKNNLGKIKNKIINVALTCDGEYLLFCPLSSRMIYSVLTKKLRDESTKSILINDVKEAYKNDASSSLIYSNMGNLYFTGLENYSIYIANQIENDLALFDFNNFEKRDNETMGYPTKLSITDGILYITSKKIEKEKTNFRIYNQIFSTLIDKDKSYIYKCEGLAYKWKWTAYAAWLILLVIIVFVWVFVSIGNEQDKKIIKKNN